MLVNHRPTSLAQSQPPSAIRASATQRLTDAALSEPGKKRYCIAPGRNSPGETRRCAAHLLKCCCLPASSLSPRCCTRAASLSSPCDPPTASQLTCDRWISRKSFGLHGEQGFAEEEQQQGPCSPRPMFRFPSTRWQSYLAIWRWNAQRAGPRPHNGCVGECHKFKALGSQNRADGPSPFRSVPGIGSRCLCTNPSALFGARLPEDRSLQRTTRQLVIANPVQFYPQAETRKLEYEGGP